MPPAFVKIDEWKAVISVVWSGEEGREKMQMWELTNFSVVAPELMKSSPETTGGTTMSRLPMDITLPWTSRLPD
jgi:hypothetical protein